jgi:type I restriction enzyme, S subunit
MNWPQGKFSEVAEIITGNTPPKKDPDNYGPGVPWVKPPDLDRWEPVTQTAETLSPKGQKIARLLPQGTVMVCCIGSIGRVGISGTTLTTNQQINSLIFGSKVEPKFGFYYCRHILPLLQSAARNAVVPILNKSNFGKITMPLPSISEQRRIVEVLDQADSLRKKRAEADAKAARILPALFYKMFGDPLALMNSREGVILGKLNVDLQNGFACGEKDVEDGVPHLRMNNIDDAGVINLGLVRTVPLNRDTERYRLVVNDVLFMGTNSEDKIGKTCLFLPPDDQVYLFSNHLIRLRVSDSRITPEYLTVFLYLLWTKKFFPSIAKRWVNQASVMQSSLAALRIPIPAKRELQIFTNEYRKLLSLRAKGLCSGKIINHIFIVLLYRAFIGDLTAKWRETHMKELLGEMKAQAKVLG